MGSNVSKLEFSAIFDSGTLYTLLSDPAYTFISESVSNLNNVFHDIMRIHILTNEYDLFYFVVRFPSQRKPVQSFLGC